MEIIRNQSFGGERPLFESHNLRLENVVITEGESGIKECSDIEADHCRFEGKYPLWHVDRSLITHCYFAPGSRSAIWYSNDMEMSDCVIDGPKFFREMRNLKLRDVTINDADETFWNIDGLDIDNVTLHEGTYPFMGCSNVMVRNLKSDSKYVFQYVKNVEIHNAHIVTKDAFWEVENVTIYDSYLDGEYLGWHSKACDRAFEYSTLVADIRGTVTSVKNPASGRIVADGYGEIIIDKNIKGPADCEIITRENPRP